MGDEIPSTPDFIQSTPNGSPAPGTLPLDQDEVPITLDELQPAKIRILVVDDEALARATVSHCLKKCGYQDVTVVDCGQKAIELLRNEREPFSLVLSDVHMPNIDGVTLLREIRNIPSMRLTPVIMMSATEDLDLVWKCLRNGADDYLLKPIRMESVKNVWSNVWRKRKEGSWETILRNEESKRWQMNEQMAQLENEIKDLKGQVTEAVETPIHVITRTVENIFKKATVSDEVRKAMSDIIVSLSSSNLYRPALSKIANAQNVDDLTKSWLLTLIDGGSKTTTEERKEMVWPSVSEPDTEGKLVLRSWDFNLWEYSEDELLTFAVEMFKDFDLLNRYHIPIDTLHSFLLEVRSSYNNNPYHNFRHAIDVTQGIYFFLTTGKVAEMLSYLEIFAVLVAALCHDLRHPGLNNTFLIDTNSALALRYNDRSVLENYHCAEAFQIMMNSKHNILAGLTRAEYKELRTLIVNCILATDMSQHMELTSRFEAMAGGMFSKHNREHRALLLSVLLKCADIGNPTRPFEICRQWAELVQEEFFLQGDSEKRNHLTVSPYMDRQQGNLLSKMQLNFIDYLVLPLYSNLKLVQQDISICVDNLLANRTRWSQMLASASASSGTPASSNTSTSTSTSTST